LLEAKAHRQGPSWPNRDAYRVDRTVRIRLDTALGGAGRTAGARSPRGLTGCCSLPIRRGVGRIFALSENSRLEAGEQVGFMLTWSQSYRAAPEIRQVNEALATAESFWSRWSKRCEPCSQWTDAVMRSLLVLKSLSHCETGDIVAAGTTSLPEKIGGNRNWDCRYCWLRCNLHALFSTRRRVY
jgi:hypothetical protein